MLLIASLILTPNLSAAQSDDEYKKAVTKAAEAYYIQSGIDRDVNKAYKEFERKYIPMFIVNHGGIFMFIGETVYREEIRINFRWTFP